MGSTIGRGNSPLHTGSFHANSTCFQKFLSFIGITMANHASQVAWGNQAVGTSEVL